MKINTHKEEENSYEITNTDRNGPLYGNGCLDWCLLQQKDKDIRRLLPWRTRTWTMGYRNECRSI